MGLGLLGHAVVMFVVTNVDDMVMLVLFFGRAPADRAGVMRVVAGQYLGFLAILAVSVVGALGASLLPDLVIPYLGVIPVLLGVRAAWQSWRARDADGSDDDCDRGVGVIDVAAVTFANGGDNVSVYVPVFAAAGVGSMAGYVAVFLVGVAVWCVVGWYVANRPAVARLLTRWGHVIVPVVLVAIGLSILVEGGAFGL